MNTDPSPAAASNEPATPDAAAAPAMPPAAAVSPTRRTGRATFWEDLIVTAFGFATSTGVAWLSWFLAAEADFAVYTWMLWFVVPAGAILCGMAAATGYWIGARLFNHRPSRGLLVNIVLVSFITFFAIHHFHYTNDKAAGRPISSLMSFSDYLVAVTENMTYKSSRSYDKGPGMELGKLGWGVAALQVLGFSIGGFMVYGALKSVPYCDRCAKYLSEKKKRTAKWKEAAGWHAGFQELAGLMQQGQLQAALDAHAPMGEGRKLRVGSMLTFEMRKCPGCENRRLRLTAQQRNGNQWAVAGQADVFTEEPLRLTEGG